jgi:hypothetical protein
MEGMNKMVYKAIDKLFVKLSDVCETLGCWCWDIHHWAVRKSADYPF